jgi:SAM-dependent methyltransferase
MVSEMGSLSFIRYLEAKKSVDDRSLNSRVWHCLAEQLHQLRVHSPLRIIEAGAGIGTMLERMLKSHLFQEAHYTGLDIEPDIIAHARASLPVWASEHGFRVECLSEGPILLKKPPHILRVEFEVADILSHSSNCQNWASYDLLVANAFLDLTNVQSALPRLLRLLKSEGLFYLSINYDGVTILEPVIDSEFDQLVLDLYHRTMDERLTNGLPSGDSRAGRHLFGYVRQAGGQILAAGASDWVIFPGIDGYPEQDADFLHFIIQTIYKALRGHESLDQQYLDKWINIRHAQIKHSELVYIAHQIDILGTMMK